MGLSPKAGSFGDCWAERVAEIRKKRRVRSRGRSRLAEGQRRAEKRGGILPGRMFLVRINGCKSFSNKSLRGKGPRAHSDERA